MIESLITLAVLSAAVPLSAQVVDPAPALPALTMEQETTLRCGVAFALVQQSREAGDAGFQDYPELGQRGQEFFVRTMAQLMEQTGANRDAIAKLVMREAEALKGDAQAIDQVMPACLLMLEASGL